MTAYEGLIAAEIPRFQALIRRNVSKDGWMSAKMLEVI